MVFCKKERKKRQSLKPREGPYKKTNAYTIKFCGEQIMTFVCALGLIILHSIFSVAAIFKIDNSILYVLLSVNYALVIGLVVTYVQVTTCDPVDSFILEPILAQLKNNMATRAYCHLCQSFIHQRSYHCKRCGRCTENFDHHCIYLNSCIGSKNYELFFRILVFYIVFLINNMGQAIWVFVAARSNAQVKAAAITEWVQIGIIGACFAQLIATTVLLSFHCYISCCLDVTTLMFIESEEKSQKYQSQRIETEYRMDTGPQDQPSPSHLIFDKTNNNKQSFQHSGLMMI